MENFDATKVSVPTHLSVQADLVFALVAERLDVSELEVSDEKVVNESLALLVRCVN